MGHGYSDPVGATERNARPNSADGGEEDPGSQKDESAAHAMPGARVATLVISQLNIMLTSAGPPGAISQSLDSLTPQGQPSISHRLGLHS